MNSKEFAKSVGGKIAKSSETGKERLMHKNLGKKAENRAKIPKFKTPKEREDFYYSYIPALYFVELCQLEPEEITTEHIQIFWAMYSLGRKIYIEKYGGEEDENG